MNINLINEARINANLCEFYAKAYAELTETEKNTVTIGGRTMGEYISEEYQRASETVKKLNKILGI